MVVFCLCKECRSERWGTKRILELFGLDDFVKLFGSFPPPAVGARFQPLFASVSHRCFAQFSVHPHAPVCTWWLPADRLLAPPLGPREPLVVAASAVSRFDRRAPQTWAAERNGSGGSRLG